MLDFPRCIVAGSCFCNLFSFFCAFANNKNVYFDNQQKISPERKSGFSVKDGENAGFCSGTNDKSEIRE